MVRLKPRWWKGGLCTPVTLNHWYTCRFTKVLFKTVAWQSRGCCWMTLQHILVHSHSTTEGMRIQRVPIPELSWVRHCKCNTVINPGKWMKALCRAGARGWSSYYVMLLEKSPSGINSSGDKIITFFNGIYGPMQCSGNLCNKASHAGGYLFSWHRNSSLESCSHFLPDS